jgi:hypothetical protein
MEDRVCTKSWAPVSVLEDSLRTGETDLSTPLFCLSSAQPSEAKTLESSQEGSIVRTGLPYSMRRPSLPFLLFFFPKISILCSFLFGGGCPLLTKWLSHIKGVGTPNPSPHFREPYLRFSQAKPWVSCTQRMASCYQSVGYHKPKSWHPEAIL